MIVHTIETPFGSVLEDETIIEAGNVQKKQIVVIACTKSSVTMGRSARVYKGCPLGKEIRFMEELKCEMPDAIRLLIIP